jgi:hypothetical protein
LIQLKKVFRFYPVHPVDPGYPVEFLQIKKNLKQDGQDGPDVQDKKRYGGRGAKKCLPKASISGKVFSQPIRWKYSLPGGIP